MQINSKFKISKLAIIIVLLSIFIPSYRSFEHRFSFGYPFSFLTIYHSILNMKANQTLLQFISIKIINLFLDFYIVDFVINFIKNKVLIRKVN
ncbi:hypothetical protein WG909_05480 [Peptostreptococcaceae bacterium AGR-M142]